MRALRRVVGVATIAAILLALGLMLFATLRGKPQDLPWTPLDLGEPIGLFTGPKLAALRHDFLKCRALLARAGVHYAPLPQVYAGVCGYDDGIRLAAGGARRIAFAPADPDISCPIGAGLAMWEWDVVQPAARRLLGSEVVSIDHYGSYNCRHIAGERAWSEHATANAIDIAGFRLANGKHVTVVADWRGKGPAATFLHEVRNGGCGLFSTVLSPDYNAAHRNHLHLDQATHGAFGWRACR